MTEIEALFAPEPETGEVTNDAESAEGTPVEEPDEAAPAEKSDDGEVESEPPAAKDADGDSDKDADKSEKSDKSDKSDDDDVSEDDIEKDEDGKHWVRKGKWNKVVGIFKAAREAGIEAPEDLQEALGAFEHRRASIADFQSPDPRDQENFLDQWRSTDPQAFQRLAQRIPTYLERADPEAFSAMVEPLARNQVENFYHQARQYQNDPSLSEEDRTRVVGYYLTAGMMVELSQFGNHRSAEEVLGQKYEPKPDPRDEKLKQYESKEQQELQQFAETVGKQVTGDFNAKVSTEVESILKPYKEAGATELELRGARAEIDTLIRSKLNQTALATARNKFNAALAAPTREHMRSQLSTLVVDHGKIVSSAVTIAKNSQELKAIRQQLGKRSTAAVQKREAAQRQKAPVASVGNRETEASRDWRKAPTRDQAVKDLFAV